MTTGISKKAIPRLLSIVKPTQNTIHCPNPTPKLMEHYAQEHKLLATPTSSPQNISNVGGERSYVLLGSLARLERALTKWAMNELVSKHNFKPIVVPNIIYNHIVEKCGFLTESERSQVYKISGSSRDSILDERSPLADGNGKAQACLAGTSEFALVAIHIGETIPSEDLPKKYCSLSRCYRAETSRTSSEWGLYRVHYFQKVEMVALTTPDKSVEMHDEFLAIQKDLFSQLGLHFQILDMPDDDLGLSATKKYDIEAWMAGRKRFGEISSTSLCKDYQSSRLKIKFSNMIERDNQLHVDTGFVHTINGTACSTIRTLIALVEQNQTNDGRVVIPEVLVPYMNGSRYIPEQQDSRLLKDVNLSKAD